MSKYVLLFHIASGLSNYTLYVNKNS